MAKRDDFEDKRAQVHFDALQAGHRSDAIALLRRLADSDVHNSFDSTDLQTAIMTAAYAGVDVVSALLRTETIKIKRVAAAEDRLKQVLFPTQALGPSLAGKQLNDFLRQLADDLEELDKESSFHQLQTMKAVWRQIAAL